MEEIDALTDIEPRIPEFKDTLNYCMKHMFQDLSTRERMLKIDQWLNKHRVNRSEVLTKAVEICLRARDAADKAQSVRFKNIKSSEEQAMIAHIEKLIDNA